MEAVAFNKCNELWNTQSSKYLGCLSRGDRNSVLALYCKVQP